MKVLFAVFVLFLLSACASTPKTEIVVKETYLVVETPKDMLTCGVIPAPPDVVLYSKIDTDFATKEKLLTDYGLDLLSALRRCQVNFESISKYQKEQMELIRKTERQLNESKGIKP